MREEGCVSVSVYVCTYVGVDVTMIFVRIIFVFVAMALIRLLLWNTCICTYLLFHSATSSETPLAHMDSTPSIRCGGRVIIS